MSYKKDMSKYEHLEGWERCGFGEQLDKWAEKYGERTAVTDSEDEISYMELKQQADCLAAAFLRKGILKGDKVLVQLPNRISFVIVFFALSKIGAVPIMMLPAHREAELEGIIELAKPAAYIVVEKYLGFSYVPMANAMKEKYSCIRHIFVDSESGDISGMIAETCGENGAFPAVDGYETAVLLLSGGTTGVPKLIPRTHTDYMYNARMSAKRCRLDSSDVYLASLPGQEFAVGSEDISTAATVLLAIVGFMILYRISKPLNWMRWTILIGSIIAFIFCSTYLNQLFAISDMSRKCIMLLVVFSVATEPVLRYLSILVDSISSFYRKQKIFFLRKREARKAK